MVATWWPEAPANGLGHSLWARRCLRWWQHALRQLWVFTAGEQNLDGGCCHVALRQFLLSRLVTYQLCEEDVASGDGKRLEQLWGFMAGVQRVCVIPWYYFLKELLVVMDGDLPAVGSLVWQLALRQLLVFMDGEHIVVLRVWKSALRQLLMLTGHGGWTFWCLRGKKQALRQLRTNYPPCHGWQARCRSRVGKGALRLLQVKPITWLKGHCKWLTKLIANKQAVPKGPIPSWMLSPACHSLSKSIAEFVKSKNFTLLVSFSIHQYMHKHKVLTFVFFDKCFSLHNYFLRFQGFFYSAELDVVFFSSDILALDLCTKKRQVQVRLMENLQQIFFHLRWKNICWRWKKICWIFPLFSTFSLIFS